MRIRSINTECGMMRAISSHRDLRRSKMRFLIVSAVLACAAAAPSHLLAPVAAPVVAPVAVAYSAPLPTISPGDVQAAAIDAQVKAQDLAIAAVDKARELSEQASEDLKDKIVVGSDAVKENNEEAFWAVQDKQWQALDALKTAEAQLDGALASNAPVLAKNVVSGAYIAGVAPVAPVAAVAYTPGFVAPVLKTAEPEPAKEESKAEEAKTEEKSEALVKSAEENKDSVIIEASTKNLEAKPQIVPAITPLAIQAYYNQGYNFVAPVAPLTPIAVPSVYSAWPQVAIAPTVVKTAW